MKKYFEPELTVVRFNLKDVLASSTPNPKTNNQPIIDEEGTPWSPYT